MTLWRQQRGVRFCTTMLSALALLLSGQFARGATYTWNGASGATWNTSSTNWTGSPPASPWVTTGTDAAMFSTANASAVVSGTVGVQQVLATQDATISGGVISGTASFTTMSFGASSGRTLSISSNVTVSRDLTFGLSGYSGTVDVSGQITAGSSTKFTVTSGATLRQSGGLWQVPIASSNPAIRIGNTSLGTYTIQSGTVDATSSNNIAPLSIGYGANGRGTMNIDGATAVVRTQSTVAGIIFNYINTGSNISGVLNFTQGEIQTSKLARGVATGTATFAFGGSVGTAVLRPFSTDLTIGGTTGADNDRLFTLMLNGTNATINSTDSGGFARTVTIYNPMGGTGNLTFAGSGTTNILASNTSTGSTTVSSGVVALSSTAALGTGVALTIGSNGWMEFANAGQSLGAVSNNNPGTSALNFTALTGTIALTSLNGIGSTRFGSSATVTSGVSQGTVTTVGLLTADISGGTVTTGSLSSSTISGGAVTVGAVATIGTLSAGTVSLNGATSTISALAGGRVNLGNAALFVASGSSAGAISGISGSIVKNTAGTLVLSASNSYGGGTTLLGGALVAGNVSAFGTGTIALGSAATLDLGGIAVANAITNQGGTLQNAQAFQGIQTIAGVATLSGTVGGTVNVASGGTLKGSDTAFTGAVTIGSGGSHSPGNSPGVQSFGAGVTYADGSAFVWELWGNTATLGTAPSYAFDQLSVTGGTLSIANSAAMSLDFGSLAGGSTVDWADPFWSMNQSWKVIDVGPAASWNGAVFGTLTVGPDATGASLSSKRSGASFTVSNAGGDLVVSYVIVPEPTCAILATLGLIILSARKFCCRHDAV